MTKEVRDYLDELPPEDRQPEAVADQGQPSEQLADEGRDGMGALTQRERERYELQKSEGQTSVTRAFGKIDFFDSGALEIPLSSPAPAMETALRQPFGDKGAGTSKEAAGAKTKDKSAESTAAEFEQRGRTGLAEAAKGLKYTTDGSAPPVVPMIDQYTVSAEKSPFELAEERLGPSASAEQKEHYAQTMLISNDDFNLNLNKKIAAGTVLHMPGQTADGGITYKDSNTGARVTQWQDVANLKQKADGSALAQYTTKEGWVVDVRWSPKDKEGNREDRTKGRNSVSLDSSGVTLEKDYDDQRGWDTRRFTHTDDKGRTFVGQYNPGDSQPHTITITNPDKSTVELKPAKDNDFVSADGKTGMDQYFNVYSQAPAADGSLTRTYENGYKEGRDSLGRVVHTEGKDEWGRASSYDFTAGEETPHTVRITPREGEAPIEFKRQGSSYSADLLDADQKKIGTIEIGNDSQIIYKNDQEKTQRTQLRNGATFEKVQLADGSARVTIAKGGENQVTEYGKKGTIISETAITSDGRAFTNTFSANGKSVDTITIKNTDGSKTELTWDKNAGQFRGGRKDSTGKVLEKVTLLEDKLVYTDVGSGAQRAEKYAKLTEESLIPSFMPGQYDRNEGIFTYKNSEGLKIEESFAPGRSDQVKADGSIEGSTVSGDKSSLKPSGEATVEHSDETGVRLNADNTVDRWGPLGRDNAVAEKLSAAEESFVKTHADIDRRDVAEIHRRFAGDNAKLESFYKELSKIDTAKNLSDAEKSALRQDLMHHVAFPQEIYQGRTPSCNVSVVERDMAMARPGKYVATIVHAVSEGTITTSDGTRVPLNPKNLKLADSSGRDLGSRIFQTTAIQAEFYPRKEFRNSEDGVGRLYPTPYNPAAKPATFAGMTMPQIADVRYKLTGEEKGITQISNVQDLLTAFESNGGQPMIIAVDGNNEPFGGGGPVGKRSNLNHVVTITRIEQGTPIKVYVANQWGLNNDHSTPETAIAATELVENMQFRVKIDGKTVTEPGMVLSPGDHTKGYKVKQGKVVEDKALAGAIAEGRAVI